MFKTQKRLILLLSISVIVLLGFVFRNIFSPEKERVTIAIAEQPVVGLIYIADSKGYFKEEGLDVRYRKFFLGRDALIDTMDGKSDLATVFETPVVRKVYEGEDLKILTTLHKSTRNTAVISLESSGIKNASDLKGKRIATQMGTSTEYFLYLLLTTEGISRKDVEVVDIPTQNITTALDKGDIDAVVTFNPHIFAIETEFGKKGIGLNVIYSDLYTERSVLTGKARFINHKNDEKIKKILRALVKAEKFSKKNEKESMEIVMNWLPEDKEAIANTWGDFRLYHTLDNLLLTMMNREARFFHELGIYETEEPEFRAIMETKYLRDIYPESVTID